jgi:hypothetical protein
MAVFGPQDDHSMDTLSSVFFSSFPVILPSKPVIEEFGLSTMSLWWISLVKDCAWASSTKSHYRSGLHRFHDYCDSENIPAHLCLPGTAYQQLGL